MGRGHDPESGGEWRVERWTGPGGLADWRSADENRLTRAQLSDADHVVISFTYPDGTVVHRTFTGGIEDVDRVIDYWKSIDSL